MEKQAILDAFNWRFACKQFDADKIISREDFEFILEAARLSPSSFGFEPWQFIIVQDQKLRTLLKESAWGASQKLDTASHFLLCLTHKAPLTQWSAPRIKKFMKEVQKYPDDIIEMRSKLYEEFQKSHFHLDTDRALFDWASKQCYIALGNMLTAAALIGIDSCPIEGFKKNETEALLQEHFAVDTQLYGLSYMIAFGYRIQNPKAKTRREAAEVFIWK